MVTTTMLAENIINAKPLAIRGSNEPSFTTAAEKPTGTDASVGSHKSTTSLPSTLVGQPEDSSNYYKINRYLSLIFGGVILLFLLSDAKIILQKRLRFLDKKVNDLFVLLLAMLVVALFYWL